MGKCIYLDMYSCYGYNNNSKTSAPDTTNGITVAIDLSNVLVDTRNGINTS